MQKIGLYYLRDKLGGKSRVTDVRPIGENIRISDRNGNQVILSRQDAVVAHLALGVALRRWELITRDEALEKLNRNEPITEEMVEALDIHFSYMGATKEEVEDYLGIDEEVDNEVSYQAGYCY